ncbi:hypothetical protein ccbrp13_17490 [Ktedonobacteria bacterium brp13]|nr:hypothetical protein ccbrp13_17490 [Ktedonobacteria bacterium brp13]
MKLDVDTLLIVPADPPEAGPDRALDPPLPGPPAFAMGDVELEEVELEEVELEEEAVAVPLLLPQAARIAVIASKRKVTLMNVFSDSDVRFDILSRFDIFFTSFYVYNEGTYLTMERSRTCDNFA